jgi:4-hydroxybenzoate polyprenyltransferase
MNRNAGGIRPWMELLRISNAPTVVTNVLAGAAVGFAALPAEAPAGGSGPQVAAPASQLAAFGTLALVGAGVVFVYLAGMVLNDAFDARADAAERPGRPIPSGRVSVVRALTVGMAMLGVGTAMVAVASGAGLALGLAAAVLLYDLSHRLLPGAFLLMAACRAFVPVIAAVAVSQQADTQALRWVAGGLAAYTAGISLAARDEVRGFGASARFGAWTLPFTACAPVGLWLWSGVPSPGGWSLGLGLAATVAALLSVAVGMLVARRGAARFAVPVAVGMWIGAIPLIDAASCCMLGRPFLGLACLGLWGVAGALRPRIAAS